MHHRKPTKGFLEQDNSAKSKQSFHRRKAGSNQASRNSTGSSSSSALPASADAKSKLSAFAFTKPATPRKTPPDEQVETQNTVLDSPGQDNGFPTPSKTTADENPHMAGLPTPNRPTPESLREPPQTPVPRLNIRDLLQSTEEDKAFSDSQADELPGEHVTWQKSTPIIKKKRSSQLKRNASSSPPEVRTPAAKRQLGNSSILPSSADPAMQLWKKYGSDSDSAQRPANPAARLFAPDRVDKSPSNLRRSTAPGAPTTHNRLKRRKTTHFDLANESVPDSEDDELDAVPAVKKKGSKSLRVGSLVDQVKQDLNRRQKPLASSAPLANSGENFFSSSPSQAVDYPEEMMVEENTAPATIEKVQDFDDEDDYGDFDIDMETIDEIERQSQAYHLPPPQLPTVPAVPAVPAVSAVSAVPTVVSPALDEFNEFSDDDIFCGAEFEQLVAQFDTPAKVGNGPTLAGNVSNIHRID
ncbi:hypothetical protein K440DRAFT_633510 [Wilcoxina mikolae CBS 423.85]|nr:hypothetical protein K440DRAFT_633510 [Wilcoxina mikolae CBS 423.85]